MKFVKTVQQLVDLLSNNKSKENYPPCPNCGLTAIEFNKTNKFGCPSCYYHYNDNILGMIKNFQEDDHHIGKKPKNRIEEKIKTLKLKIAKAKELEDYKKIAQLNVELNSLLNKKGF